MLGEQRGVGWLICCGKLAAGYAIVVFGFSLEHSGRTAELDELFVSSKWRGKSLGASLLRQVLKKSKALGLVSLHLETMQENQVAREFYARFGFANQNRVSMQLKL